jgi:hypothetical protein
MKKVFLLILFLLLSSSLAAHATLITTSGSDNFAGDDYSYLFEINVVNPSLANATLTNTSTNSLSGALIDLLAFNMDATLGTDFTIKNISPTWVFAPGNGGVEFDYVGERVAPGDRLAPDQSLTFDFEALGAFELTDTLWTDTDSSFGTGIGGGEDFGQVAVSFQQLGSGGGQSDLVASTWTSVSVPESATLILLGLGIAGVFGARRKFKK